jgi:predicted lipoprotein with Yx(FWY)xxD motif
LKRTRTLIAASVVLTTGVAAATAQGVTAHASAKPSIKLVQTSDGKLVAASNGHTLYMFTHDKSGKDTCQSISMCSGTWPAYTVTGKPVAGSGIKASKLGTVRLKNGKEQVTYYGHPLYKYAFDSGAGETGYIGASEFGGSWYGITAAGKTIK